MSENQIRLRLLALPLAFQLGVTQRNVAGNRLLTLAYRPSHSASSTRVFSAIEFLDSTGLRRLEAAQ